MFQPGAGGMGHLVSGEWGPAAQLWVGETVSKAAARQPIFFQQGAMLRHCVSAAGTAGGGAQAQLERGGQERGWTT